MTDAPVVEVGAGTGRVTRTIAAAIADVDILAVEPSAPMRAVLTSRAWADPDLRARVTVSARSAPDLDLPGRILCAVVFGVAGHLERPERTELWRRLSQRLVPGGCLVVELMGSARAMPPTRTVHETVGRLTYEWWVSAEPVGDGVVRHVNWWRVLEGDRVCREVGDEHLWHVLEPEELAAESGLRARTVGTGADSLVVLEA
nr:class I SAM-dependent methyltransferase [Isoptericola halotolerans]